LYYSIHAASVNIFGWGNLGERDHLEDPGVDDGSSGSRVWGYGLDRAGSG
jgi:hypothetical protein